MKKSLVFSICTALLFLSSTLHAQCPVDEADLANGGTFSGTCNITVGGNINITGNVTWTSGTLTISGNNGDIDLAATFDIQGGSVVFDNGDGDIDINAGGTLIVASGASFTAPEEIDIQNGGALIVSGDVIAGTFIDVENGGSATVNSGGNLSTTTGNIEVKGGGTMDISGIVTAGTNFEIDGGDVTVNSGGQLNSTTDLFIDDGGTLNIQAGGAVDVSGNVENNETNGTGDSEGTITLNGTLTVGGNVDIADTDPDSGIFGYGSLDVIGTFSDAEIDDFARCSSFPCLGPGLDILNAPASVNTTSSFNVTFEWKYDVTGFTVDDIAVGNGSAGNFMITDANTYTADITPDGMGNITIDVGNNEVEEGNGSAVQVIVLYDLESPTITFLNVPPVATATAFTITIRFNEDVQDFVIGDIDVTNSTKGTFTTVNASTYTQVITATGAGSVGISINASVATDLAGNQNTASSVLSIPYTASKAPGNVNVGSNLSLWLSADQGATLNGSTISDWADQSGNSNDATQATDASQPEYESDDLNGNPSFRFDGIDDVLEGNAGFNSIEYYVVAFPSEIYNSGTSTGSIIGFETGDFARLGLGPTSGQIADEVITHSAGSFASYRGAFTSTSTDLNLPAIINVRGNATANGSEIFLNGINVQNAEANAGTYQVYTDTDYDIGDEIEGLPRFPFNGSVSEVISYSSRLTDANRRDVSSYLAIKYGITLDITTQNYTTGGTSIYSATGYPNDIAGIGIQLNAGLNKTSSKSENSGSMVRMEGASDLEDAEFLVWGNNGTSNTFTTSNVPVGVIEMLEKVWTVDETGGDGVGTVTLSFDLTSLGIDIDNSTVNLIILAAGNTVPTDFATQASLNSTGTVSTVDGRDIITFTGVDFTDGDFFTIGGDIQTTSPGGSNALSMWFRADQGITSSGGLISSWADQSGNSNDVVQGASPDQPTLVSDAINFNNALQFTGGDNLETIDGFYTEEYFLVIKPDNAITNAATNGYVLGFESQNSGGFFIGDENFIGNDLFGQTMEIDGYNVSAITPTSISNDNVVVFNVRNNADAGPTAQEMYANGTAYTETTAGTHADFTDNALRIGDNFANDRPYSGLIAEILSYSSRLTSVQRRDVESYLGLKYGITLDIDGGEFYTADGTDIYTYTGHDFDIAGLGKHRDYGLNQTKAISQNTGTIIKMEGLSDLDDNEYLMWGYDGITGGSKTIPDANEKPALIDERLPAEWRVAVTGSPGTVTVKVYVGGITNFADRPQIASLYTLLINDNDDFSTITSSVSASSLANDTLTFSGVTFANGDRFTLALPSQPDLSGLTLWLKSNAEVEEASSNTAENGDPVQFWRDQSGNNNDLSQATLGVRPTYLANQLNGNPVITFDDANSYLDLASTNLNPRSIFIVYNDVSTDANTTAFTNDDNDDGLGIGYGGTTNLFDASNTPADVRNGDNFVDGTDIGDGTTQARPANYELHSRIFVSNLSDASWNYYVGNDRGNTGTSIGGGVAEIIVYTTSLSATARRDVESYLAIKYGITLDITTLDYTYNSGTAIFDHILYSNDIAGIGANSTYGFSQSSGISNNSDALVTMSNPSGLSSGDFVVWGNDDGATGETTATVPPGIGNRMTRIWGVNETNDMGTVTVSFDLTGLGYGAKAVTDFTLIVDTNADFSDGTQNTYSAQSFASDVVTFANVDFTSATNFGLGTTKNLTADTDTDGIPDYFESAYGTNHNDGDDPVAGGSPNTDVSATNGVLGDGISDALESILVSNGATAPVTIFTDSDGDGIPDHIEVEDGTDPFSANAPTLNGNIDSDGDGIPDGLEALIDSEGGSADPLLTTDTDSDGIPDFYEVMNGSDPNDVNSPTTSGGTDSDGDGISDALESQLISGSATAPIGVDTDTDGDGIPDYIEVQTFSDPFNSVSPGVAGSSNVRSLLADYEVAGGNCVDVSGYQWIHIADNNGNLVFSINPVGNNLGSTCWGVRVLNGESSVRDDGGDNWILNRNWYITPTNAPSSEVYVRFYSLNQENTDMHSKLVTDGETPGTLSNFNADSIKFTKISGLEVLDPLVTGGTRTIHDPVVADYLVNGKSYTIGISSFSSFVAHFNPSSPDVPLPVELVDFYAEVEKGVVKLIWSTASELNNDHFVIERSIDGEIFQALDIMDGQGTSNELVTYEYSDKIPVNGLSFYRLKQVDFDGTTAFSEIIQIDYHFGLEGIDVLVYPNPAHEYVNIKVETVVEGLGISLIDQFGRNVTGEVDRLGSLYKVSTTHLMPGIYIVNVRIAGKERRYRLQVNR